MDRTVNKIQWLEWLCRSYQGDNNPYPAILNSLREANCEPTQEAAPSSRAPQVNTPALHGATGPQPVSVLQAEASAFLRAQAGVSADRSPEAREYATAAAPVRPVAETAIMEPAGKIDRAAKPGIALAELPTEVASTTPPSPIEPKPERDKPSASRGKPQTSRHVFHRSHWWEISKPAAADPVPSENLWKLVPRGLAVLLGLQAASGAGGYSRRELASRLADLERLLAADSDHILQPETAGLACRTIAVHSGHTVNRVVLSSTGPAAGTVQELESLLAAAPRAKVNRSA